MGTDQKFSQLAMKSTIDITPFEYTAIEIRMQYIYRNMITDNSLARRVIRENIKALKRENYVKIINQSINESLSRTIVTSLTTFFVVLILWLFGGEVIHNFALAMIIGVIVGTYSSIYIASPIVIYLHDRAAK